RRDRAVADTTDHVHDGGHATNGRRAGPAAATGFPRLPRRGRRPWLCAGGAPGEPVDGEGEQQLEALVRGGVGGGTGEGRGGRELRGRERGDVIAGSVR